MTNLSMRDDSFVIKIKSNLTNRLFRMTVLFDDFFEVTRFLSVAFFVDVIVQKEAFVK